MYSLNLIYDKKNTVIFFSAIDDVFSWMYLDTRGRQL